MIALVITIIVLLILAGIAINLTIGQNGIFTKSQYATNKYEQASINEQKELNKAIDFIDELSMKLNDGKDTTMAMFDVGKNVATKMRMQELDGNIGTVNLSIDAIKRYTGNPDLSSMTEDNIVSFTDGYNAYEQNPEEYRHLIPEGTKLCPIYMWFEESGKTELRNILSVDGDIDMEGFSKEVKTGTIYWWSESENVYLNPDSSYICANLPYLSDISGFKNMAATFVTNANNMFGVGSNHALKNVDALLNWDTKNITDMSSMFVGCLGLTNISALKNWNTSKVTNMSGMFSGGGDLMSLTDITPLSNWDVSNVENMSEMFSGCTSLTDASAINDWNIIKVTNFEMMFSGSEIHPNFSKVEGEWNDGTFIPKSE